MRFRGESRVTDEVEFFRFAIDFASGFLAPMLFFALGIAAEPRQDLTAASHELSHVGSLEGVPVRLNWPRLVCAES